MKNKQKKKKKKLKKKLTKESSISSTSSFKKGRATYTNIPGSPSRVSSIAESTKKVAINPIPENTFTSTFGNKTSNGEFVVKEQENEIMMDFS